MYDTDQLLPWHRLPIIVLDVETTGLSPKTCGVVEIAAVRFELGKPVAEFGSLVNPGHPIPPEVSAIHGITDDQVADSPSLDDVINDVRFCEVLLHAQPAAYNAPFDSSFLPSLPLQCDPDWPWLDPLVVVRSVDRYVKGKGRHKLEASCKRHGVTLSDAHRATADARAAGELLFALRPHLGDMTMSELLRRQQLKRVEQNRGFKEWKSRVFPQEASLRSVTAKT